MWPFHTLANHIHQIFLLTHPVWDVTRFSYPFKFLTNFYSHIPCGMWRNIHTKFKTIMKFLLTHPVWDVTTRQKPRDRQKRFLLTHPVWDVTMMPSPTTLTSIISTHTSRVGCDADVPFLRKHIVHISTHTSRVGCDNMAYSNGLMYPDFYSHIPCGMWRQVPTEAPRNDKFLLTHPVWDVTLLTKCQDFWKIISTHTSRVGCDPLFFMFV